MTPGDRLDAAETSFSALDLTNDQPNYVCLQALLAIGRLLQQINDRQAAQAAQQAGS